MNAIAEIGRDLLGLPATDRERLILKAWESLVRDPDADPDIDPEGVELAEKRNGEIDSNNLAAISHEEFVRRTSGD